MKKVFVFLFLLFSFSFFSSPAKATTGFQIGLPFGAYILPGFGAPVFGLELGGKWERFAFDVYLTGGSFTDASGSASTASLGLDLNFYLGGEEPRTYVGGHIAVFGALVSFYGLGYAGGDAAEFGTQVGHDYFLTNWFALTPELRLMISARTGAMLMQSLIKIKFVL